MNFNLKDDSKEIMNLMINQGYASTKASAIRLALIMFKKSNFKTNNY
ncbi:MAG: hypothetical protein V1824_02385 [archaeon]